MQFIHDTEENQKPNPPPILYKYLSPERVSDVLETQTVKFTKLANTNDDFEVRRTFKRMAGSRFEKMFDQLKAEITEKEVFEKQLDEKLKTFSRSVRRKMKKQLQNNKNTLYSDYKKQLYKQSSLFTEYLNTEESIEDFLRMKAEKMLCFSMSDGYDLISMWGRYADSSRGFVIGFKTDHPWFKNKEHPFNSRLHKIIYTDQILEEPLEDPEAAFNSKVTSWSDEREWRMYCSMEEIQQTIDAKPDPIYLIKFPSDLVECVIIGRQATNETKDHIKRVLEKLYPKAKLLIAKPNAKTASYDLLHIDY